MKKRGIDKENDKFEIDVPVFYPTIEEMRNFEEFIKKLEKDERTHCGLAKVVPPYNRWNWAMDPVSMYKSVNKKVIKPIKQFVNGRKGSYKLSIVESKARTVESFQELCKEMATSRPSLRPSVPCKSRIIFDGSLEGAKLRGIMNGTETTLHLERNLDLYRTEWNLKKRQAQEPKHVLGGPLSHVEKRYFVKVLEGNQIDGFEMMFVRPLFQAENEDFVHVIGAGAGGFQICGTFDKPSKRILFWQEDNETNLTVDDIVKRTLDKDLRVLENHFWSSMTTESKPPLYGGDQAGSVFQDADADGWNLNQLDTILRIGCGKDSKGITSSMLYFGMWRAMFAMHTEDLELNSINFVHYGAPKIWYAIPAHLKSQFEGFGRGEFASEANICGEFMRHKNIMIAPKTLRKANIKYARAYQLAGEFMVTFPNAYHAGFNAGFNVAEAVNFATPSWLQLGRKARVCKCVPWAFHLDVDAFADAVRQSAPQRLPSLPQPGDRIRLGASKDIYRVHQRNKKDLQVFRIGDVKRRFLPFNPLTDEWHWTTDAFTCPPPLPPAPRPRPRKLKLNIVHHHRIRLLARQLRWYKFAATRKQRLQSARRNSRATPIVLKKKNPSAKRGRPRKPRIHAAESFCILDCFGQNFRLLQDHRPFVYSM